MKRILREIAADGRLVLRAHTSKNLVRVQACRLHQSLRGIGHSTGGLALEGLGIQRLYNVPENLACVGHHRRVLSGYVSCFLFSVC